MSTPTKRMSKPRSRRRRSHYALTAAKLVTCSKCKKPVLPHRVCKSCGFYKGKEVLKIKTKLDKSKDTKKEK